MKKFLISLLVVLLMPYAAFAEEGPVGFYFDDFNYECGELWVGDEFVEYEPGYHGWKLGYHVGDWDSNICRWILDMTGMEFRIENDYVCEYLEENYEISDTYDSEAICDFIGYTYIGEVPSEEKEVGKDYPLVFAIAVLILVLFLVFVLVRKMRG